MFTRRLALAIVLLACAGGGVGVLAGRQPDDCAVVNALLTSYSSSQAAITATLNAGPKQFKDLLAAADAQSATAGRLRGQASGIVTPTLRAAAIQFADGVQMFADNSYDELFRPASDFDPVTAALAPPDPAVVNADETYSSAVRALTTACPSARKPAAQP